MGSERRHRLRWATPQEIDDIMALAIRVNDFLSGRSSRRHPPGRLQDGNGRLWENEMMRIVVADESPRFVSAVGHQVEREARQGSLSIAISAGCSKPIRRSPSASAS